MSTRRTNHTIRSRGATSRLPASPARAASGDMSCPATRISRRATASRSRPGGGEGWRARSPDGHGEDDFVFMLSRDELLDLFFEDLELPDLVKLKLKDAVASSRAGPASPRPARPPSSTSGAPCATAWAAASRCAGRARRKLHASRRDRELRQAEALHAAGRAPASRSLRENLHALKRRRRRIAYVDPVDVASIASSGSR